MVSLGKNHIEPHERNLLFLKQGIDQLRQLVAPPRPAPDFTQTFFIHIHNNDALIERHGHRGAQTRVVDDVIQTLQHAQARNADCMQQSQHQRSKRDRNPRPVFCQCFHVSVVKKPADSGAYSKVQTVRFVQIASGCQQALSNPHF